MKNPFKEAAAADGGRGEVKAFGRVRNSLKRGPFSRVSEGPAVLVTIREGFQTFQMINLGAGF